MKRLKKNGEGQTSLDFLIGITLFLLVFIFVFAFIPRMFTPFQTNSDELTMAADRAAQALVENQLIDNRHFDSGRTPAVYSGESTPGIIYKPNFDDLKDKIDQSVSNPHFSESRLSQTKIALGMGYEKSFGKSASTPSEQFYNFQIVLSMEDGTEEYISPYGDPVGSNVGQSKRFVFVANDDTPVDYKMAILTVRVW